MNDGRLYRVICYMRVGREEKEELLTREQAQAELEQLRFLQPEHLYRIEPVDPSERAEPPAR